MQLFHKHILRFVQHAFINTSLFSCPLLKAFYGGIVNIIQRKGRQRKIIPCCATLTHQKGFQSGTGQNLPCAAASIIIDTLAGNAYRIGRNINLDVFFSVFFVKIDTDDNAHSISDLVGYIFKELAGIGQADHITVIVTANIDFTTLCVGITANPFQIFVFPFAFPFNVLALRHFRHRPYPCFCHGSYKHYTYSCTADCRRLHSVCLPQRSANNACRYGWAFPCRSA